MFGYDEGTPRERYDAILDHLDAMYDDLKTEIETADARADVAESRTDSLLDEVQTLSTALQNQREATNLAYSQRAIAAVALAHTVLYYGGNAGIGLDSRENQPNAWRVVLYVDTPAGQLSWHIAPDDQAMLEGLPTYSGKWDGTYHSSNQDFYKGFIKC